ncbi:four helix bundle protein [soil metagenome]
MQIDEDGLPGRTKRFALRIINLCEALLNTQTAHVVRGQLLRSGTSVGANYRAACCAKSPADFISKMGTVEEETDESLYWMELLIEADIVKKDLLSDLMKESSEILAMTAASINTARRNQRK